MIYVVLRSENLLPVRAYTNHIQAILEAGRIRGEVASIDLIDAGGSMESGRAPTPESAGSNPARRVTVIRKPSNNYPWP